MFITKKIKTFLTGALLSVGFLGISGNAQAQFQVIDWRAIIQDSQNFQATQGHYGTQISHYAEQIKKYEQQIQELERSYNAITGIKFENILDLGIHGQAARIRLGNVTEGTAEVFGLGLPETPTEDMTRYHRTYRLLQPEELYPDNLELQRQTRDLHQTLFVVDGVTGATNKGRKERLEVYAGLAEMSAQAVDTKGALEVNNALLLENGRNLALLIELQTAQLAAESVKLKEKVQSQQSVASVFGAAGQGL